MKENRIWSNIENERKNKNELTCKNERKAEIKNRKKAAYES